MIVVSIVEMIVNGIWLPVYFRVGIPLYRKSIFLPSTPNLSLDELNQCFEKGVSCPILFKRISPEEIAFRGKLLSLKMNYTPIMHGLIRNKQGKVQLVGYANLFPFVFLACFVLMGSRAVFEFDLVLLLFAIGIIAVLYIIQVGRYNKIFRIISGENKT